MSQAQRPKRTEALTEAEVLKLVELQLEDEAIIGRLDRFWVAFKVDDTLLARLKEAGASNRVLDRLRQGKEPGAVGPVLADDPERSTIAVWVKRYYTQDCPLHSELRVNGE